MADLTPAAFTAKWNQRFADNDTFNVDEQDLREFTADQLRTFVARAEQLGKVPAELLLPQQVIGGQWYWWSTGVFEARGTFQASASPVAGPNWRLVVAFSSYGDAQAVAAVRASGEFNYYTDEQAAAAGQQAVRDSGEYLSRTGQRVVVVQSNGTRIGFANALDALYYGANAALEVYGVHDLGENTAIGLSDYTKLHMAPGSDLRCREIYASQNRLDSAITGSGTIRAILSQGPGSRNFSVEGITLFGRINPYAYNANGAPKKFSVKNCRINSGSQPALTAQMGFGANYSSPVAVEFYGNIITTTSAKVFQLYDNHVTDNGGTVELNPSNSLDLKGNVINAPASAVIVDRTGGPFVLKSNGNYITATGATVLTATGTAVTFDEERLWPVLTSGTYTVSPAGASPGVCVQLTLAAGCTEIQVPGAGFVKYAGSFVANAENSYSFLVRQDGKVSYYINQPAA